jgi:GT2 family glycosyltransferase
MTPKISVITVNYNGKRWLKDCLSSLSKQTYKNYEIILVDNGSTDGSAAYVKSNFPKVKVIRNKENSGFAGGNNLGYQNSDGDYILLLNNDTKVNPDFLEKFYSSFKECPTASVIQSSIVYLDDSQKIDTCGSYWTDSSFLYYIGNSKNTDDPKYQKSFKVFSTKGASTMIKSEVIDAIGLFNDSFWNYYEETDFCHRAWLAGYEVWYSPKAVCHHSNGGTSLGFRNDFIQYHNFKNKLTSFLTNFETQTLISVIPTFLIVNLLLSLIWLVTGKYKHSLSLLKGMFWNIYNLRNIIGIRKNTQSLRKKSDGDYLKQVKKNPRPTYYYYLLKDDLGLYTD